ncbi:lytic polysaccharide monooxygenase [Hebeloma cylindrosporum]|uniref:lytic cellulose monooxygenase (C4-dehydrogenating) n=1 Tax=Hebeloma cylindrosporum TaxID=76867 RepID=A0A0C2YWB2_HEBCY|nr:lytic polysaccharide monooxygenase [Hebeloma cylindrosporum h7]
MHAASGHGFVHSIVMGGQDYPGWNPFVDPYANNPPRVVRKVLNDGFVANTDPDIACHHGGNDGTTAVGTAPSGSQVSFQWAYWPGGKNVPALLPADPSHRKAMLDHQGPVSTYMTSCNGDCSTFAANGALWFKIDADGYDSPTRQWAAAKLISNNSSWTSTIPPGLAPGQYLLRNEIIALHSSAPQFYPSCSQVQVTGSGTGTPSQDELVSMQTLYNGVVFPDIYADSVSFTIPGPPLVNFDSNGGGSQHSSTASSPLVTTSRASASLASTTMAPVSTSRPSGRCMYLEEFLLDPCLALGHRTKKKSLNSALGFDSSLCYVSPAELTLENGHGFCEHL